MSHPAYPTPNERLAERAAAERDIRDMTRLTVIDAMITRWTDAMIPFAADLEHPRRRWSPHDLIIALGEAHHEIQAEIARIKRNPVFIEDQET
jgi:hypothetical protein